MEKKKILHIAQSYGGGVTEYLYLLLENTKNIYSNILILSEEYKEQEERFSKVSDRIFFVPMVKEVSIIKDIKSITKVKKIVKKIKPEVAYLHSSKAGAIGRIALLFNFKTKIIYNAHGWYFNAGISNKKKAFFAIVEKILAFKTNKIINISQSEYDSALKYKITSSKKMCVIENGIDFSKFKNADECRLETRTELNISDDEIVIGVVGRISEQKDPMTSIKAFKKIKKEYPNTKLLFVGSGELEENVRQFAQENNINEDVIITGWVNCVEKYIPAFDIAILPSKWEGFGLVIVEYMACNKPIIASNIGGISNIIENGRNGYLIQPGNVQELYEKSKYIIENYAKIQKTLDFIEIKEKYDIKNVIKKHMNLFEE